MKQPVYFWAALITLLILAIGLWLGFVQVVGGWLWKLLHAF